MDPVNIPNAAIQHEAIRQVLPAKAAPVKTDSPKKLGGTSTGSKDTIAARTSQAPPATINHEVAQASGARSQSLSSRAQLQGRAFDESASPARSTKSPQGLRGTPSADAAYAARAKQAITQQTIQKLSPQERANVKLGSSSALVKGNLLNMLADIKKAASAA